jgi:uncharacterized membrane protein
MKRPILSIELNQWDIWMETTAWTFLLILWIYPLQLYAGLPEQIPSHFGLDGVADGYDKKQTILLLPIIATIINVGLWVLGHYPHLLNYATRITEENAVQQYRMATRIIRISRILISALFYLIVYRIIAGTQTGIDHLGKSFMPWIIGLGLIPALLTLVMWWRGQKAA